MKKREAYPFHVEASPNAYSKNRYAHAVSFAHGAKRRKRSTRSLCCEILAIFDEGEVGKALDAFILWFFGSRVKINGFFWKDIINRKGYSNFFLVAFFLWADWGNYHREKSSVVPGGVSKKQGQRSKLLLLRAC